MSVGSASGLGTDVGPEVERAWPGNIPRAGAEDHPGLSTDGHVLEESKSVNGDQHQGMQGPEAPCAALSVRLNYSLKCEATPTYQITDSLITAH